MSSFWQTYVFHDMGCLGPLAGPNGPVSFPTGTSIQSFGGTTEYLIVYPCTIRPSSVLNPTYMTISGTVYYATGAGQPWNEYLDGSIFNVDAVDDSDNILVSGEIDDYSGDADGNRIVRFNPASATDVYGFKIHVSGTYSIEYVKTTVEELDANLRPQSHYIQQSGSPYQWQDVNTSNLSFALTGGTNTLGSGIVELEGECDDLNGFTNYAWYCRTDLLPAMSAGKFYWVETHGNLNPLHAQAGWAYYNGPPIPDSKAGLSALTYMYHDVIVGTFFFQKGWHNYWNGSSMSAQYYTSTPPSFVLQHEQVGTYYARIYFEIPSGGPTFLSIYNQLGTSVYFDEITDMELLFDFGEAGAGTKFRLDIADVNLYNIC